MKVENFTVCGDAFRVIAFIKDGKPRFTVELVSEFDVEGLTTEQFNKFCDAAARDSSWTGVLRCGLLGDMKGGGEIV